MYSGQPEIFFFTIGFVLAFLIALFIKDKVLGMIVEAGFVRPNFKGAQIPLAAGIVFLLAMAGAVLPLFFLWPSDLRAHIVWFLLAMCGATFLGLLDDFWGSRDISGLTGHFKALLRGRLTTGAIKALGGGLLAFILSLQLYPGDILHILDSTLIIGLSINMINLFDLRPGRAGKAYILVYFILLPASLSVPEGVLSTMTLGVLLAFLPADIKARAMMGDTGSNTLGIVIGLTAAAALEGPMRAAYLVTLLLIHIITEKYSLSHIISNNSILNYFDMLGRDKK